jgi:hypothetical protein
MKNPFNISISHHNPEWKEWMAECKEVESGRLKRFIDQLSDDPALLSSVAEDASSCWMFELLFEKTKHWNYLRIANLGRTWHWKTMFDDGPHTIHLPEVDPIKTGKVGTNIDVPFDTWVDGVYLAMILRDEAALKVYRAVPFEPLHNRLGAIMDEFNGFHHRFLVSIGVDDQEAGQSISNMFDHVRGKRADYESQDLFWVDQVTIPYLDLWKALLANDESAFNVALRTQQKGWKKAYSSEDRLRNEIHGYYCMPALTACAMAFDRGMKITVKSDYLPVFLIEGERRMHWPNLEWVK